MFRGHDVLKHLLVTVAVLLIAIVGLQFVIGLRTNSAETDSPLLLGTSVWPGYEPLYLARCLGYYDDQSIRLVEFSSASQVIREFRNGTIQAAAVTLDEALLLKERGMDFRVILITDISNGADVIVGKPEISSLSDLHERPVGVEHTALGAYVLTRALRIVNLSVSDVDIVPIEVDEHEQAFDAGRIDAVVTFEPVRSRLLAKGAVQLFDSSQIPDEIIDVLIIRDDALESHRSQIEMILAGWFEALAYLRESPDDAGRRMSGRLQLSPDDVLATFDGLRLPSLSENLSILDGDPAEFVETAHRLAEAMNEEKLLQTGVLFHNCISTAPLKTLLTKQPRDKYAR